MEFWFVQIGKISDNQTKKSHLPAFAFYYFGLRSGLKIQTLAKIEMEI